MEDEVELEEQELTMNDNENMRNERTEEYFGDLVISTHENEEVGVDVSESSRGKREVSVEFHLNFDEEPNENEKRSASHDHETAALEDFATPKTSKVQKLRDNILPVAYDLRARVACRKSSRISSKSRVIKKKQNHRRSNKFREAGKIIKPSSNWRYICDKCGKRSQSPSKLLEHLKTHLSAESLAVYLIACPICNMNFSRKSTLNRHTDEQHNPKTSSRRRRGQRVNNNKLVARPQPKHRKKTVASK